MAIGESEITSAFTMGGYIDRETMEFIPPRWYSDQRKEHVMEEIARKWLTERGVEFSEETRQSPRGHWRCVSRKVVLLGDSIRMIGYGPLVPRLLGEAYDVWQPEENCRFAQYTLRGLFDWAEEMEDVYAVHWNNGLWDVCDLFGDGAFTDEDTYVRTMLRIAGILKSRARRVIFATTTPVHPLNPHNRNAVIERYNRLLVPKLREMGVEINDLYSLLAPDIERHIRADDRIHLTEEGSEICARAVANSITSADPDFTGWEWVEE